MKGRSLAILAAVVIAVLAYILLVERHRPTSDEVASEAEKVLQDFDRDQVTGIVIERDPGRVRLEKVGEAWRLREPLDFPADESAVSSTLGTLANLQADRRLSADEVDPAVYGLDDPPIRIMLRTGDGGEIVLEVSDEMPLGSKRALRLLGGDEIMVVSGWFVSDLEREVDDWRSREVVDISEDRVASIDIGAGEDRIRAVRLDESWQLLDPVDDLGDRDHLQSLVRELHRHRSRGRSPRLILMQARAAETEYLAGLSRLCEKVSESGGTKWSVHRIHPMAAAVLLRDEETPEPIERLLALQQTGREGLAPPSPDMSSSRSALQVGEARFPEDGATLDALFHHARRTSIGDGSAAAAQGAALSEVRT